MKLALLVGLFAVMFTLAIYWPTGTLWRNHYDDAYITYRYAINMAEHGELAFNVGERTDAESSTLYTLLLAVAYRCGLTDLEVVSCVINMVSVFAVACFVYLCVLSITGGTIWAVCLGLIASLHGFISGWASLGMETVFFAALITAFVYFTYCARSTLAASILLSALIITRIEGALLLIPYLAVFWRNRRAVLSVFCVIVCYYLLKVLYFGSLLPDSFYAKTILISYQAQPSVVIALWRNNAIVLLFLAALCPLRDSRLISLYLYTVLSFIICVVGPNSEYARYSGHLLPVMVILASVTVSENLNRFVLAVLLAMPIDGSIRIFTINAARNTAIQTARSHIGDTINQTLPRDAVILSSDIGAIAYRAKYHAFVDIVGLTSRDVRLLYAHGKNAADVLYRRNPRYLADSFQVHGKSYTWPNARASFLVKPVPPSAFLSNIEFQKLTLIEATPDIAIALVRLER